ncbi:MAG: hypothetical protein MPN21_11410 [Thermoanaerobaculia bacterium]|nr:hypothetical protein [Thermoanaerobaculia bacterium]
MTPSGPNRTPSIRLVLILFVALLSLPATADWLVMEDGSRLETRGPWSVDGRRVIFTQANGTLSALRTREVDLTASEALTEARERAAEAARAEPPAEARPEPRWVFTNRDIPTASPVVQEELEIEPLVGAEGFTLRSVEERVDATGNNLVVRGVLINDADIAASLVAVRVSILSPVDGGTLDVVQAIVSHPDLLPNSATRFTASFDDLSPGFGLVQVEVEVLDGSNRSRVG